MVGKITRIEMHSVPKHTNDNKLSCYKQRHVNFRPRRLTKASSIAVQRFNQKTIDWPDFYIVRQTIKRSFMYKTTMNNILLQRFRNSGVEIDTNVILHSRRCQVVRLGAYGAHLKSSVTISGLRKNCNRVIKTT